jgi:hypothetical protein
LRSSLGYKNFSFKTFRTQTVTNTQELKKILDGIQDLYFASTLLSVEELQKNFASLENQQENNTDIWFLNGELTTSNIRVKRYRTGHWVLYNEEGLRFLFLDPDGRVLHECEWDEESESDPPKLSRARMRLDSDQWVGIKPQCKEFSTDIDINGQPGWKTITKDGLRKQAAEAWQVPMDELKYFYGDDNFDSLGEGKYHIHVKKDGLFALRDGRFEQTMFISFMFSVNWGKVDIIPVVELFQSTLPGTGGAVFEFIWGLYNDQNREQKLSPLRYRGLPTYPSKESFNIFSAFFEPSGPNNEDIFEVFMDTYRSHEIEWRPRQEPPWRYFNEEHQISVTVQNKFLYKAVVKNDPITIPFVNFVKGGNPPCQRHLVVEKEKIILKDRNSSREIPMDSKWNAEPIGENKEFAEPPFSWDSFFEGDLPKADPIKAQYTVALYPEGKAEIDEGSIQPIALDQIFYYMEENSDMPEKLEAAEKVLIHTMDMVIAGCVDCGKPRDYTVLYSDPELAIRNAQLLWSHAASRNELENLKNVKFFPEIDKVEEAYSTSYDMIFKWMPLGFYHDRENCEAMLAAIANALRPGGMLFLIGPLPLSGLLEHYGLNQINGDPIVEMPFFQQHLKMCPENLLNPQVTVFLLEKKS